MLYINHLGGLKVGCKVGVGLLIIMVYIFITELTKFLHLDERHEENMLKGKKFAAMKKQRSVGEEMEGEVPSSAPGWAVK